MYDGLGRRATDRVKGIVADAEGNILITGESSVEETLIDFATIKYDSNGRQLWERRFDHSGNHDNPAGVAVDDAGAVYVTGRSRTSGNNLFVTLKYGSDGNLLWTRTFEGAGADHAVDVVVDAQGNVIVTGYFLGDYVTIKYDTDGNEQWVARYDNSSTDLPIDLAVDGAGNVYVTGSSWQAGSTNADFATVKYDPDGEELWVARYVGENQDGGMDEQPVGWSSTPPATRT